MPTVWAFDGLVPVVDPTSYVHPSAVLIGDVIVGPGCYIGPFASLRGDFGRIVIEADANVQDGCVLHSFPARDMLIEAEGHIGHSAVLHCCTIRRGAMVGMNSVINDGAVIGEYAIVAAQAFVKAEAEIPARWLAAGIPAKPMRALTEQEMAWKVEATRQYQRLTERSLATMRPVEALTAVEPGRPRVTGSDIDPLHVVKGR